jgi:hypothetical protein
VECLVRLGFGVVGGGLAGLLWCRAARALVVGGSLVLALVVGSGLVGMAVAGGGGVCTAAALDSVGWLEP